MKLKRAIAAAVSLHMLAWLVMLVALAGVLFIAVGIYWLIAPPLGPAAAALIVGGGLLGLLLLACVIVWLTGRLRRAPPPPPETAPVSLEDELQAMLGENSARWLREHTGLAMTGALAAGTVLAMNPRLRASLSDAARPILARRLAALLDRLADDT